MQRISAHLVSFVENDHLAALKLGLVVQLEDDLKQRASRRRADEAVPHKDRVQH